MFLAYFMYAFYGCQPVAVILPSGEENKKSCVKGELNIIRVFAMTVLNYRSN